MNKKKLSVVMAGAMLATSVAPVLAAEVTAEEVAISKKSLLKKEIMELVNSKLISTNTVLSGSGAGSDFVSADVADLMKSGESAYGIKVLDKEGKELDLDGFGASKDKVTYKVTEIATVLGNLAKKDAGNTVQVVERENSTFLGQVIPGTEIKGIAKENNKFGYGAFKDLDSFRNESGLTLDSYINATDKTATVTNNEFIKSVTVENGVATVTLNAVEDLTASEAVNKTLKYDKDSIKVNFKLPLDAKGNLLSDDVTTGNKKIQECANFAEMLTYTKSQVTAGAEPEVRKAYKLVDDSAVQGKETYLASALYDGLALTAKGSEIKADLDNAAKVEKETGKDATVKIELPSGVTDSNIDTTLENNGTNGVYSYKVLYFTSYKDVATGESAAAKVVTIKSTNAKELVSLYKMLTGKTGFGVEIVAGANRYETAVNVAKESGIVALADNGADSKNHNEIVLVNGDSLVDGLSAAPLAAELEWNNKDGSAVLLTKADTLAKETKEYLEELTVNLSRTKRGNVTIHLVGGEAVLTPALEKELKDMGFDVVRHGGDNREETSLEVAKKVAEATTTNGLFIVGANGEADAMSVAAVAARDNDATPNVQATPIIVAKNGGLSKEAVKFIEEKSKTAANSAVAVIGGEKVVSKADYDKIDAVTTNKVARVAGENRFETNAAIIDEYYKNTNNFDKVVLVKDGQNKKGELIDALSAANFAGANKSPIVLATNEINEAQKVALLNNKKGTMVKLTQVGEGVARSTLEAVAEFLGLSNK